MSFLCSRVSKSISFVPYCHIVPLFVEKGLYPKTENIRALAIRLRERESVADEVVGDLEPR